MTTGATPRTNVAAALERLRCDRARLDDAVALAGAPWREAFRALCSGPDPAGAIVRAAMLPPQWLQHPFPPALVALLHQGGYPGRLLALSPEAGDVLQGETAPQSPRAELLDALRRQFGAVGPTEALGRVRTREYLRLCRREIEGAPLEEVGGDLCTLVECCLQVLLEHFDLHRSVVVFGMGKLGGHELNFLSDIDLLFVHADELPGAGPDEADPGSRAAVVELHDRLRRLIRLLEGKGPYRPLFRVDLRLRPFGSRGPLSMSLSATEAYYERYGRSWERQAWIKARPLAGDLELGRRMQERLLPFVYRRSVSPAIFDEIGRLMLRARRDAPAHASGTSGIDLKLDSGGIREVEFFVQALQLLHGGKNPAVRSTTTLTTLDHLLAEGLVSDREHRDLVRAYRFLRRVEHRLQLGEGQQTHRLPDRAAERALLGRRLAYRPSGGAMEDASLERFDGLLAEHRARVRAIARTLTGAAEDSETPRDRAVAGVLDFGAPSSVRHEALAWFGVRDPAEADALLQHLASRQDGALATRGPSRRGIERLIVACLESSDPDIALVRLVEFASLRPAHYGIWRLFAEPPAGGRDLLQLTAELFGTSEALSRGLIGFPPLSGAFQDESITLLQTAGATTLPDPRQLGRDLAEHPSDPRGLAATMLRFKHREMVSIALLDLGRRPDPLEVGRALSDLADLVLRIVARDLAAEWTSRPSAHGLRIAVMGLGKLGMQAMDYGSDIDLMFVFDTVGDGPGRARSLQTEAIRLGQALITRLQTRMHGMRLYEVDMRLRPSGRQGLLVSPLGGFRHYHDRSLPVWETLALLRMRPILELTIGDELAPPQPSAEASEPHAPAMAAALPGPLCESVRRIVEGTLRRAASPDAEAVVGPAIRRLKARIEAELARENRNTGHYNAKSGAGGPLELELLVGGLQLVHGTDDGVLWHRGIVDAIDGLATAGVFSPDERRALSAAYRFQRLFLNRLRMTHHGGIDDPDRFAQNSPRLTTLARRMGLPNRETLLEKFFESRAVVRDAFERHLRT